MEKTFYELGFLGIEKGDSSMYESIEDESNYGNYLLAIKMCSEIAENPNYLSFHLIKKMDFWIAYTPSESILNSQKLALLCMKDIMKKELFLLLVIN